MGAPPRSIEQRTHGSDHRPKGGGRTKHASSVRPACGCGVSFASFLCPDQRKEGDTPESKKKLPRGRYLRGASPNINELTTLILTEKLSDTISLSYLLWSKAVGE